MKQHPEFPNIQVADHPLILHKLSLMRESGCPKVLFKSLLREIGVLMAYEITKNLPLTTREIETPLTNMQAPVLGGRKPVIVSILRAGLGMVEGLEEVMPSARVGHIGIYRDENTKEAVEYLVRLPDVIGRIIFLVDPMLATGNSAKHAIDVLVKRGVRPEDIRFMVLVAAPEGVRAMLQAYPQVQIYTAAIDERLNEHAYIVPGLGDAGDRLFGTKHA